MARIHHAMLPILILFLGACKNPNSSESYPGGKHTITDMAGRKVEVPDRITSVIGADMTVTLLANSLVPSEIIGRNTAPSDNEKKYIPSGFCNLPVIGVIFYGRSSLNTEQVIKLKPQILLCPIFKHTTAQYIADYESCGQKIGASVVMVNLDLEKLPETYLFLGKLLDKPKEAEVLAQYCRDLFKQDSAVRTKIKDTVTIYIAEDAAGLYTIPAKSTHSQVFEFAGLKNCASIDEAYGYNEISISMEQIITWNPDYIIVNQRGASNSETTANKDFYTTPSWKTLKAVKNKHILFVPAVPYNWIGRPPGINRLIGIRWLISSIYPQFALYNLKDEIRKYFGLFYHSQITDSQIDDILTHSYYVGK